MISRLLEINSYPTYTTTGVHPGRFGQHSFFSFFFSGQNIVLEKTAHCILTFKKIPGFQAIGSLEKRSAEAEREKVWI